METPSRILSLRMRLYSSASAAVLPLSAKNERCPISSAGMGVFTTESWSATSSPMESKSWHHAEKTDSFASLRALW